MCRERVSRLARPLPRVVTRAGWEEDVVEVAEVATELEEALTEASAATAGEAASSRADMEAVGATRATTRDSPSTGAQVGVTATLDPPGEGRDPASAWEVPVTTPTTRATVEEDTGLEATGAVGAGGDTRTEGINDEQDDDDDINE